MNKPFIRYWLPLLAHMMLIYFLSSRSHFPVEAPSWMFFADKIAHAMIFGLLGFLFLRAWLHGQWEHITTSACVLTVLFVLLYGISDEAHQMFVPNRTPSVEDIIADVTGGCIAAVVFHVLNQFGFLKRKHEKKPTV